MISPVLGIHHVTAICGDPQTNLDFYTGLLGLRLLKLTVNFDDPGTYHLYYGDGAGTPGSAITFFPWVGAPHGRVGTGQATVTAYSVPFGSLPFWKSRLSEFQVAYEERENDYGEQLLSCADPDGAAIQIVASANEKRPVQLVGSIPEECAIRGFHSVVLTLESYERTAGLLTAQLGLVKIGEHGNRFRFATTADALPGTIVDLHCQPDLRFGNMGVGTTHHVAWRAADDAHELQLRERLIRAGQQVTPVIDRTYFHSVYFREPGHVLFEIATDQPGFTFDEPLDALGRSLRLPTQHEPLREQLVKLLPPLRLPETDWKPGS